MNNHRGVFGLAWSVVVYCQSEHKINKRYQTCMILNPSDPTGTGLFSKYARNQAMKTKSVRPASASKSRSIKPIEASRKKSVHQDSFSKQESRDQRQKKYSRNEAPPVGQYNPHQKDRPKLVWDILKVYQHQSHSRKTLQSEQKEQKNTLKETVSAPTVNQLEALIIDQQINMQSTRQQGSLMSSKISKCMVNMSRMSGRKEKFIQSRQWAQRDGDILQSLSYVKSPISKNIIFDKMQSHPTNLRKAINPATNYSFDYKVLKQRKSALIDFSTIKGRQQKQKKQPTYAYQHYDFDNYVWQKQSRVYPNTKTHLIDFSRQTDRYRQHA